jgi:hypothetical protein
MMMKAATLLGMGIEQKLSLENWNCGWDTDGACLFRNWGGAAAHIIPLVTALSSAVCQAGSAF